ncbi:MAG: hypothetical protein KBT48_11130 [Firmicutes bacterium]|nr:hypothetical protein [Bacillota bacterium]
MYLVDTENVGSSWRNLLPSKTNNEKILLFYTENSPHISYVDFEFILQYPGSFEMIRAYTGKNALDFQLVSYLGYLLKTAPKTHYVIVSADNGYEPVIQFWKDREISISRMNIWDLENRTKKMELLVLKEDDLTEDASPVIETLPIKERLKEALNEAIPKNKKDRQKTIDEILAALDENNLDDLRKVHNDLVKGFGMEGGSKIYKQIKTKIKNIDTL